MVIAGAMLTAAALIFQLANFLYPLIDTPPLKPFIEALSSHLPSFALIVAATILASYFIYLHLEAFVQLAPIRIRNWLNSKHPNESRWSTIQADAPITDDRGDELKRNSFIEDLARDLILPPNSPSIVFGLEDSWGQGKTSSIHLLEKHIAREYPNAIVIRFNPWEYRNVGSPRDTFLLIIASELRKQSKKHSVGQGVANKIEDVQRLGMLFDALKSENPFYETAKLLTGAGSLHTADVNLESAKNRIDDALKQLNQPVLVIIDDLDRCPPDDIRTIFQLVKSLCDYSRFAYLLAYDSGPVIKALEYDDTYDGGHFLEKIVQAVYHLPRFGYVDRRQMLDVRMKRGLESTSIQLTAEELDRYNETLIVAARALKTPREITRIVNRAMSWGRGTRGEVDFGDLLLHAILATKYTMVWKKIRSRPNEFTIEEGGSFDEEPYIRQLSYHALKDSDKELQRQEFRNSVLELVNTAERDDVADILALLFPTKFKTHTYDLPKLSENRTAHLNTLLMLLSRGAASDVFSANDATHFINDPALRGQIYLTLIRDGNIRGWLPFIAEYLDRAYVQDRLEFWRFVIDITRRAFTENHINIVDDARYLLMKHIETISNPNERAELLELLANNEGSLSLSENVLLTLVRDDGLWVAGTFNPQGLQAPTGDTANWVERSELLRLTALWLLTVERSAAPETFFKSEAEPLSVLFRWGQLSGNDYSKVHDFMDKVVNNDIILTEFAMLFIDKTSFESIEKLVRDWPHFVGRMLTNIRVDSDVKAKLRDYIGPTLEAEILRRS